MPHQLIGKRETISTKVKLARDFLVFHAKLLGNIISVRYQTNNALRTVARNLV